MKFLNHDKVLCLSPHPDDVEYAMLGSIMKFKDTQFDVIVLSNGGDFDETSSDNRCRECENVWEKIDNLNGSFIGEKFIKSKDEDEWVNLIESKYDISSYDTICIPPECDSHFEHSTVNRIGNALTRRQKCGIINYKTPSTLDDWKPNFFVNLDTLENREGNILFSAFIWYIKLNKLNKFVSQSDKSYFKEPSIVSFHSDYQCSIRGLDKVESFKICRSYN